MTRKYMGITSPIRKKFAHEKKTLVINACKGHQAATGTWSIALDNGTALCDQNQTAATFVIPVEGMHTGDVIDAFRLVGSVGAKSGGATTVDADLRTLTKGAGSITDASVGAITQVDVQADTALDSEKASLAHQVLTDYSYYVLVTVTTADNAENDVILTGVEVDVNQ